MLNRIHEARKNQSGFTLIELLMVIVILGILSGIVVFAVNGIQDRGAQSACKADVKTVSVAAEAAYAQNTKYPHDMAGLVSSGFLHQPAADVDFAASDTTITTLQGLAGSPCAGYKG
ncbi:type II secretion system protein [Kribbella sp. NPDC004536]|uniref:type II secretion system protein n=1 Tax=Kribbella sp. NPDC004536 TaxID=3364106 RepID=UPI003675CCB0